MLLEQIIRNIGVARSLNTFHMNFNKRGKWYFVAKIVLTYYLPGHPELTSNKMAQIWNNLQLNNAKSIADVRASALEWYRTNLQN